MAEYTKLLLPFVIVGGLDLKTQPDLLAKGSYSRFKNLEAQLIGHAPQTRRVASFWPLSPFPFSPVDSIRAVFFPQGRTPPPISGLIGAAGKLYDVYGAFIDDGYSTSPKAFAEYRTTGNSNAWILVADFNKMTKVQPFAPVGPVQVAKLGISPPGAVPPFIGAGAPAVSTVDGAGNLNSSTGVGYDWRYTYYSSVTQAESNPSAIQAALTSAVNQSVDLTPGALSSDPQVDTIRWWRRGGTLGDTWRLVGTQGNVGVVSGNIVTTALNGINQQYNFNPNFTQAGHVVTVTLVSGTIPAGVRAGDTVTVANAVVAGYNGNFTVSNVISTTQFQYYNPTSGLTPTSVGTVYWSILRVSMTAPFSIAVGARVVLAAVTNPFYDGTFEVRTIYDASDFGIYYPGLGVGPGPSDSGTVNTLPFNDNSSDLAIASADVLSLTNDVPVTTIDSANNTIYEQPLPYLWGPYQGNIFFGTGDPYRPGYVYWCNPGNPDGWSSVNNVEVTPPTDPLANGFIWSGRIFAFSGEKLMEGFPLTIGNIVSFQFFDAGAGHGLAASWAFEAGLTSPRVWWATRSAGIVEWGGGGPAVSITEEKLWPLFNTSTFSINTTPIEGLSPVSMGSNNPRMKFHDQELRFSYTDTNGGVGNLLAYNIYTKVWRYALYPWNISCMETVDEGEDQTFLFGADSLYGEGSTFGGQDQTYTGGVVGLVSPVLDLKTGYLWEPDYEALKEYNSLTLDFLSNSALLNFQAIFADGSGAPISATVSTGSARGQTSISLAPGGSGENSYARDVAIEISGATFAQAVLYGFEIAYLLDILPTVHAGSNRSSWGIAGYFHCSPASYLTLRSQATVIVSFYPDDRPSFSVTLPSTGGQKVKMQLDAIPANKELLIAVSVDSALPFRLYPDDSFLALMPWSGSTSPILAPAFKA